MILSLAEDALQVCRFQVQFQDGKSLEEFESFPLGSFGYAYHSANIELHYSDIIRAGIRPIIRG